MAPCAAARSLRILLRAECRHQAAVSDDVGRARLDDIEAVSWITLAKYGLAGGHMDRFQTAGKLFNSGQRQRLKHGHPVEQPDFLVQFSDVAVEVSQATPCHHHEAWTKRADDHQCNGDARPFDQERNESAQPNAEGDQALEQAEYAGEDLIGANLAINVNKPTSTSALPIPTHARSERAVACRGNNRMSAMGNPHNETPMPNH